MKKETHISNLGLNFGDMFRMLSNEEHGLITTLLDDLKKTTMSKKRNHKEKKKEKIVKKSRPLPCKAQKAGCSCLLKPPSARIAPKWVFEVGAS